MFGGDSGTTYLNDTWSFDGTTWAQIATQSAPPARACGANDLRSVTQKLVLFGGFNGTYLVTTWLWDGSTLQWTQATPQHHPPAVTSPMLFPDPNGRADLFWRFDGHFYQLTMWQMGRFRLDAVISADGSVCSCISGRCTNTSTGQVVICSADSLM